MVASPSKPADPHPNQTTDHHEDRARRGSQRIRCDQVLSLYDMWQRCAETGEHEPTDRQHDQHRDAEHRTVVASEDQRENRNGEQRLQQIRAHQHIASRPSIQEHPGERADDRVRQQQDRECRCHGHRIRLTFR